jgi:hypothetical protein
VSLKRRVVILCVPCVVLLVSAPALSAPPKIFFENGWNLSQELCPSGIQDPTKVAPFVRILTSHWEKAGPKLLEQSSKLLRHTWKRKELSFFYHVCPDMPDTSSPLSINIPNVLKFYSKNKKRGLTLAQDTIWHELLHGFIDEILNISVDTTPLLEKYGQLNWAAESHLHLMAVQQIIYKNLGMQDEIESTKQYYRENLPEYLAVWLKAEEVGAQKFIDELVNKSKTPKKER